MPADAGPATAQTSAADTSSDSDTEDGVIADERAHLVRSREFLHLMRENVLMLAQNPMAGDRVSLEYLKADLYRRAEALKDLPDAPLFFGRLEFQESAWGGEDFAGARRGDPGGRPPEPARPWFIGLLPFIGQQPLPRGQQLDLGPPGDEALACVQHFRGVRSGRADHCDANLSPPVQVKVTGLADGHAGEPAMHVRDEGPDHRTLLLQRPDIA